MTTTIAYSSNGLREYSEDTRFSPFLGQGQTIVVIDTGIDLDHPAFGADNNNNGVSDRIVLSNLDFLSDDKSSQDLNGHGTAVAGVIAGVAPNAKIIPIQVASSSGSTTTAVVGEALEWVVDNATKYNITGVNLSYSDGKNWQTSGDEVLVGDSIADPFKTLESMGIPVFAGAGNNYNYYLEEGMAGLGAHHTTIGVGAIASNALTQSDKLWDRSQRRDDTLFAPGVGLTTAKLNGNTAQWQGTSISTPFTAGASLLIQNVAKKYLGQKLTDTELTDLLNKTSDEASGFKQINVYKAAEAIYDKAVLNSVGEAPGEFLFDQNNVENFSPRTERINEDLLGSRNITDSVNIQENPLYQGFIGVQNFDAVFPGLVSETN